MMKIDLHKYPLFQNITLTKPELLPRQGFSNENYIFTSENKKYLLRRFKLPDRDRELEYRVQNLAYEKGLAAKPYILDLPNALMICEFLEGEHRDTLETEDIHAIVKVLKKVHALQVDVEPIQLETLFTTIDSRIEELFRAIASFPQEHALCHNDPNPKNMIFTASGLKLIDWEFAGINDRYFDLAAVCVEFDLSQNDMEMFLNTYFEEVKWHQEKLDVYKTVYSELCKQWFKENT